MIKRYENHPLRDLNSFHVEERAEYLIEFDSASDLDEIFTSGKIEGKWYVLGGGNNILFTKRYDGTLIHPTGRKIEILEEDSAVMIVKADAGVDWDEFVSWCVEHNLWGAENLSLIPGTVGAAPVQNIGAYGVEAKDIISSVNYYDTLLQEHRTLMQQECQFTYRDSIFKGELRSRAIITSVEFILCKEAHANPCLSYGDLRQHVEELGGPTLKNIREAVCAIRRSKLPDTNELGNAGSFFKNPIVDYKVALDLYSKHENMPIYPTSDAAQRKLAAGWLIDQAGMKGFRCGNVGVHERQALVLVNFGGATGNEVIALANTVRKKVAEKFNIDIEPEVNIL